MEKKINPSKTKCLIHLKHLSLFSAFNKGEDNSARRGVLEYLYNNTPVSARGLVLVLSLGEERNARQRTGQRTLSMNCTAQKPSCFRNREKDDFHHLLEPP